MNTFPVAVLFVVFFSAVLAKGGLKSYSEDCGKDCEDEPMRPVCACHYESSSGSSGSGSGYGGSGYGGSGSGYGGSGSGYGGSGSGYGGSGSGYGGSGSGYGGSGYGGSGSSSGGRRKVCKTFDNRCELESAVDCGEDWSYEYKGKCKKYEDEEED